MNIPFHEIESKAFKDWMKFANPNMPTISRKSLKTAMKTRVEQLKKQLHDDIPDGQTVTISTDSWTTAFKNHPLCGVYVNYIDERWHYKSRMLNAVDASNAKSG